MQQNQVDFVGQSIRMQNACWFFFQDAVHHGAVVCSCGSDPFPLTNCKSMYCDLLHVP